MGSIVDEPVGNVEVYVRVNNPDSDDAISKIELFEDREGRGNRHAEQECPLLAGQP